MKLAIDENFNRDIVRGLLRRSPGLDVLRVQDAGLTGAEDPAVLAWAAAEGRILFTHDVSMMTRFAYERIAAGVAMPGLFEVSPLLPVREVIEEMLLIAEASAEGEWEGQVRYLPLR